MIKIIDKTPLLDEKGNLGFVQRVQGMLQFGFNWPRELEAQSAIIKFFDKQLEKGYTLIRNMTLGQSGIMIPIILLGPTGIYVIEITHLRGHYEARGESWNVESGNGYAPAPINLIQRTQRMARALQAYIERQGVRLPVAVEPVLIAGDPGLHIESNRPVIRVMMIDGIKTFVSGLAGGRATLNGMLVNEFTDRILTPRPKQDTSAPPPQPEPEPEPDTQPRAAWEDLYRWNEEPELQSEPEVSRARAIFDASKDAPPLNPNDFDFAYGDEAAPIPPVPQQQRPESRPAEPVRQAGSRQKLVMGMTTTQLFILAGLALGVLCVLAAFAYVVFTQPL